MFDIVGMLINTFLPMSKVVKELMHLIENYKINKAKVQAHARGNLGKVMQRILDKAGIGPNS